MKKIFLLAPLILFGAACNTTSIPTSTNQSEISVQSTQPAPEKWLELYIRHEVMEITDSWRSRTNTIVSINDTSITVSITQASGEEFLSSSQEQVYLDLIEPIVERAISEYPWAHDLELTVQFI